MLLMVSLLVALVYAVPMEELAVPFLGSNEEAAEIIEGFQLILRQTWISAAKVNPAARQKNVNQVRAALEEALRIEPIGQEVLSMEEVEIPLYDTKEMIQSILLRTGIYEKQLASAFQVPLSQLIGSIWTYWTLLARITVQPNPEDWPELPSSVGDFFDDILQRSYETSRKTWGKNIFPLQLQTQLGEYNQAIQSYQPRDTCEAASRQENVQDLTEEERKYIERLKQLPPYDAALRLAELESRRKTIVVDGR